ncbi:MAG: type I 3-dehydroquinate dehydratase [Thermoanaerobaculum sp.]|nr:type I 3-dehydroquinate dehydratase [Thermoanaerobaculum sp.]MDW7967812.1 type I 3-dehydroquinate dehydratase [Thermoanaerobaculum sp.]
MELVASFGGISSGELQRTIAHPPAGAHMVELRADLLPPEVPLADLVRACPLPVILTLRSEDQGGRGPNDPVARRAFFQRALSLNPALVDLEAVHDLPLLRSLIPPERALLSRHWDHTPKDLDEQAASLLSLGTRYLKLVPTARSLADVLAVLGLAHALGRGSNGQRRCVLFAQGEQGIATRLLGPFLSAPLAYGAWERGAAVAPGQLSVGDFSALVGHLTGRPRRVFAVLGTQVQTSWSPRMHAAGYRFLGLPYAFVPLTVANEEELRTLLQPVGLGPLEAMGLNVGGFAVTMPWKEQAASACHILAPRAQRAGAVNTVLPRPAKVVGDLTDVDGLTRVLMEAGVGLAGAAVAVLGTGGAARAALVALQLAGSRLLLVARHQDKGAALAARFGARLVAPHQLKGVVAFINATPAGVDGEEDPLLEQVNLPPGCVVVDLPYGDRPTRLQRLAEERGWDYVSGKEVLLYQGVSQFAAMTGVAPPVTAMAAALGLKEAQ